MNLPNVSTNLKATKGFDASKVLTYAVPVGAISISLFILVFLVWPKLNEALKIRSSNTELTSRISVLSQKIAVLTSLDQTALTSQVGYSEAILPSDKSLFSFVRHLESLSLKHGVVLDNVDVVPGLLSASGPDVFAGSTVPTNLTSEAAPKIQVKITVLADYNSFLNFISNLYLLPRVVGVRDLSVSTSTSGTSGSSTLSASMVVDAYYKSLPGQLGSVESPIENLKPEETEILSRAFASGESSQSAEPNPNEVPSVPTGRGDLFSPF